MSWPSDPDVPDFTLHCNYIVMTASSLTVPVLLMQQSGVSKAVSGDTLPTQVGWAQHVVLTARQQEVERQRCR